MVSVNVCVCMCVLRHCKRFFHFMLRRTFSFSITICIIPIYFVRLLRWNFRLACAAASIPNAKLQHEQSEPKHSASRLPPIGVSRYTVSARSSRRVYSILLISLNWKVFVAFFKVKTSNYFVKPSISVHTFESTGCGVHWHCDCQFIINNVTKTHYLFKFTSRNKQKKPRRH